MKSVTKMRAGVVNPGSRRRTDHPCTLHRAGTPPDTRDPRTGDRRLTAPAAKIARGIEGEGRRGLDIEEGETKTAEVAARSDPLPHAEESGIRRRLPWFRVAGAVATTREGGRVVR